MHTKIKLAIKYKVKNYEKYTNEQRSKNNEQIGEGWNWNDVTELSQFVQFSSIHKLNRPAANM
jgi:hypothetical protein